MTDLGTSNHTIGETDMEQNGGFTPTIYNAGERELIAALANIADEAEAKVVAHLIAAAPDILEALEALLKLAHGSFEGTSDENDAVLDAAAAAIAKARGEAI